MSDKLLLRNKICKGGLLGVTTGLIATIFDSIYMLLPQTYVPNEYPVLLIVTNIMFWAVVGSLSGFFLYIFARNKHNYMKRENFYWIIFFLLPFAIMFGLLGKFNDKQIFNPGFDNNLVFLWVIIFIICVIAINKRTTQHETRQNFFIAETLSIIALFHLCSNIDQLTVVQESFGYIFKIDFFKETARFFQLYKKFCIAVYAIGVLIIIGTYYILAAKLKRVQRSKPIYSFIALSLIATGILILSHQTVQSAFLAQYHEVVGIQKPKRQETYPSVILIVLDTLRKRSLDEHPDVFKNLHAFSKESLVFDTCIANSSWTLPSHTSLFTGLSCQEHGALGFIEREPWFGGFPAPRPLADKFTTLAEVFEAHGYHTAAIISNFAGLNPDYKLNQGFQIYDCFKNVGFAFESLSFKPLLHFICFVSNKKINITLPYRPAEDINNAVFHFLESHLERPFFLFINYMDPHDPYRPSEPFKSIFNHFPFLYSQPLTNMIGRLLHRIPAKYECVLNESLYKGEIAYLDYHLGVLFNRLKKIGIYHESLIIVTSDHGELFCEHGYNSHRVPLYEGVIRVPLYIKYPRNLITGREPRQQQYMTLADLYPTILSICSLPIPVEVSGKAFGKPSSPVVAEFHNYDIGLHHAVYADQYKYLKFEKKKRTELYDVQADPLEKNNLVRLLPEKTVEMEALLAEWIKNHPPRYQISNSQRKEVSPSTLDDLKALGYIE